MLPNDAADVFVALGVLSAAGEFETGRASGTKSMLMRTRVREARQAVLPDAEREGVAMRFLLSASNGRKQSPPPSSVMAEAATHGDIVFLNMTERFYLCAWKVRMNGAQTCAHGLSSL
jgi:hypothetical protein